MRLLNNSLLVFIFSTMLCNNLYANEFSKECLGNLETFDKKILQAGISYKIYYEINDKVAKVRFAGREFDAKVEQGKSWKGLWLTNYEDDFYFSYLPDEGGSIKFKFENQKWFSGNC